MQWKEPNSCTNCILLAHVYIVDFNIVSFHVESGYRLHVVLWNDMIYCTRMYEWDNV